MKTEKRIAVWLILALAACGCAEVTEKYPSNEAKAYFAAANEANYLGVACMSAQSVDLSAYTTYMGVKYPPTVKVEVLSEPPSRPYQAFAVLQRPGSQSSSDVSPSALAQLTNKARAIGADAIIVCKAPTSNAEVVAIKYRLENPEERIRH